MQPFVRIKKFKILFFFFVCLIINGQTQSNNIFSIENRLKFANYLFSEEDYLRAKEEYKEILKVINNDTVRFKFGECFLRIKRYEEAAENFKSLFFNSSLQEEAKLYFYKANFLSSLSVNDFANFRKLINDEIYQSEKYFKQIKRLEYISYFFDHSEFPDSTEFFTSFDDSNLVSIRNFYLFKKNMPYKDQTLAGILSSILPGAGKIYVGEISDGVTAFIVTGLLTALSINNFEHSHKFRGFLFAGLSLLTYAGNIYGSIASAQIYNAKLKSNYITEINNFFKQRNYLLPRLNFMGK